MLHTEIILQENTAHLPTLRPGDAPASLTDHLSTGSILLVLQCHPDDQGATLSISRHGVHVEHGNQRFIQSLDYVIERELGAGETYERPIHTRFGPATLRLRHEVGER